MKALAWLLKAVLTAAALLTLILCTGSEARTPQVSETREAGR
jgi:hypothetical protein